MADGEKVGLRELVARGRTHYENGEYVEAKQKVKHSNLIKIREEFKAKVMQSVGEL